MEGSFLNSDTRYFHVLIHQRPLTAFSLDYTSAKRKPSGTRLVIEKRCCIPAHYFARFVPQQAERLKRKGRIVGRFIYLFIYTL